MQTYIHAYIHTYLPFNLPTYLGLAYLRTYVRTYVRMYIHITHKRIYIYTILYYILYIHIRLWHLNIVLGGFFSDCYKKRARFCPKAGMSLLKWCFPCSEIKLLALKMPGMFEHRCPRAHLCAFFHREGLNFLRQESFAPFEYDPCDPPSLNRLWYDSTKFWNTMISTIEHGWNMLNYYWSLSEGNGERERDYRIL